MDGHHHGHDEQGHDVDDLDQGVDRRTCGVLVGVAHGVAGHSRFVGFRALAAVVSVFDVFLGVVPSTAAGTHGNSHEQTGDDGAHQQATQSRWAQDQADHDRGDHGQQAGDHHFFDGCSGQHVHSGVVLGLAGTVHDAFDFLELAAYFHHHGTSGTAHGFHGHRAEQIRNQATNEQTNDDFGVAQVELDMCAQAFEFVGVVSKQHQRGQTGRADGVAFGHGFGGVAHSVQWVGDVAHAGWQFGHFSNTARVVGDGAISVQRNHDTRHAQHGGGRDGDAVQPT